MGDRYPCFPSAAPQLRRLLALAGAVLAGAVLAAVLGAVLGVAAAGVEQEEAALASPPQRGRGCALLIALLSDKSPVLLQV
jgi:hypothetical protein